MVLQIDSEIERRFAFFLVKTESLSEKTVKVGVMKRIPDAPAQEKENNSRHVRRIAYNSIIN